ncbi:DUF397 domain-containing protein [Streptomyces sp. NA04227]|uniref:DUF397 domain-containing protein n=1 Tax=Streptomyces sp. NA04227 TaxID=2742136 RepID=UPI00159010C5|nr:DUF397 domain-containing protein [Streptomyces sp. NA04227]QKW07633.1 DUF397 domain-containing protein [Streptomyces sp. NA04227]
METVPNLTNATWRKSSYSGPNGGECIECAPLGNATWRKSSYSGDTGGDCVECAPLGNATWQKSSYSGDTGGQCIEVAPQPCRIAIRDSKTPEGPAFLVTPTAFAAFTTAAAQGTFGA